MANIYLGNTQLGKGGITPTNTLPTANAENYDKHELYLNDGELYYLDKEPIFVSDPTQTIKTIQLSSRDVIPNNESIAYYNNELYIFGGGTSYVDNKDTIYKYNPSTNELTLLSAKLERKLTHCFSITVGNYIYVMGGNSYNYDSKNIRRYDVATDTLTTLQQQLPIAAGYFSDQGWDKYLYNDTWYLFTVYPKGANYTTVYKFDATTETVISSGLSFNNYNTQYNYGFCGGYGNKLVKKYNYDSFEVIDIDNGTHEQKTVNVGYAKNWFTFNDMLYLLYGNSENTEVLHKLDLSIPSYIDVKSNLSGKVYNYNYNSYIAQGMACGNDNIFKYYELSFEGYQYVYKQIASEEVS